MNQVTIARNKLLMAISENAERHAKQFAQAQIGYRKAMIEELDRMLEEAKNGKPIRRTIALPEPLCHTEDYERVIKMLKMSCEDTIMVSAGEFENYVMDNWPWSGLVAKTTALYCA